MRRLVDQHEERVIYEGADAERDDEDRPDWLQAHEPRQRDHHEDERGNEKSAPGIAASERTDLRMPANDLAGARTVRLGLGGERKVPPRDPGGGIFAACADDLHPTSTR